MKSSKTTNPPHPLRERNSLYIAKHPTRAVLIGILLFNIIFSVIATFIIAGLAPDKLDGYGVWASAFYTVAMILDAGSIAYVVTDVGSSSVAVIIVCMVIMIVGMIAFTGAVIGYITNYISIFIEKSKDGKIPLKISGHTVILNWNSRAAETINDLLYKNTQETVVVLVSQEKDLVSAEIRDRLLDTIKTNNRKLNAKIRREKMGRIRGHLYYRTHKMKNKLSVIVREGDILSTVQLSSISIDNARTIMILGRDYQSEYVKYSDEGSTANLHRGNSNLIKTLMLVTELTRSEDSADDQQIIVEVEDSWTQSLVDKIIANKERRSKCNIVPVPVNRFLGKLLSQLAINPELNLIYNELFSSKGFFFTSKTWDGTFAPDDINQSFVTYMQKYYRTLPLSVMNTSEGPMEFFLCDNTGENETAHGLQRSVSPQIQSAKDSKHSLLPEVRLNPDYWLPKKNVIILGHNSTMRYLMAGFDAFRNEWNYTDEREILDIVIVDDHASLERHHNYEKYPYVSNVVAADIFDKTVISDAIMKFFQKHTGDISILILSDDEVPNVEIDEQPLTYLIYIDDMLLKEHKKNPLFDSSECDIIVEILNPQNFEAVRSYNSNHVVISNRYLSHMMAQIGEHTCLDEFYRDILTYDSANEGQTKELYIKQAGDFFTALPGKCTAHQLVRAVFEAGPADNKAVLMGYIPEKNKYVLFAGDNFDRMVELKEEDKLILCSDH